MGRGSSPSQATATPSRSAVLRTGDLNEMLSDPRWLGWGFLRERSQMMTLNPDLCATVDQKLLEAANDLGLDYELLFEWANSNVGRYYGERRQYSTLYRFDGDHYADAVASMQEMLEAMDNDSWNYG